MAKKDIPSINYVKDEKTLSENTKEKNRHGQTPENFYQNLKNLTG